MSSVSTSAGYKFALSAQMVPLPAVETDSERNAALQRGRQLREAIWKALLAERERSEVSDGDSFWKENVKDVWKPLLQPGASIRYVGDNGPDLVLKNTAGLLSLTGADLGYRFAEVRGLLYATVTTVLLHCDPGRPEISGSSNSLGYHKTEALPRTMWAQRGPNHAKAFGTLLLAWAKRNQALRQELDRNVLDGTASYADHAEALGMIFVWELVERDPDEVAGKLQTLMIRQGEYIGVLRDSTTAARWVWEAAQYLAR
ncbi:MAG: hypothetical protein K1X74_04850 [Pirellulales bacterium]|nr:hypothetical protein [Pirellulales bacterium]